MSYLIRKKKKRENTIQIAPLVDVMLVLLVVFISVAPAIVSGIDVNLPNGGSELEGVSKNQFITISVTKNNDIFVEDTETDKSSLINTIKHLTNNNKQTTIFIKTDRDVKYGHVINILTKVNNAGYKNTALVTNIPNNNVNEL